MRNFKMAGPAAALLACTLVACGGGGGSGGGGGLAFPVIPVTPPPTATPPVQLTEFELAGAYARYIAEPARYEITGQTKVLGEVFRTQGTLTVGAPTASTFNGKSSLLKTTRGVLELTDPRGVRRTETNQADRHYDSNYRQIGATWPNATNYEEFTAAALPALVRPGDSGIWADSVMYEYKAPNEAIQRSYARYTVEREGDMTALLNIVTTTITAGGGLTLVTTDRYRLSSDGSMRQIAQDAQLGTLVSSFIYR